MERSDVVVVGGGLAGLTAAATAARAGARVTVLEARAGLGGRAVTEDRDGFLLNEGPHALYLGSVGLPVLQGLGIDPSGGRPPLDGVMVRVGSVVAPAPATGRDVVRSPLLPWPAKVDIARVMRRLRSVDTAGLARVTLSDWLDANVRTTEVRNLILLLVRTASYSNAPELMSAGAAIDQVRLAGKGVRYLDGGWQTMVAALAGAASAAGATIEPGSEVVGIAEGVDGWEVTTSRGGWQAGAVVVAGVSPAAAARLLGTSPWFEVPPAVTASVLDLGVRRVPRHRVLFGADVPYYCSVHSPPAALAPEGHALVSLLRYHRIDEHLDPHETRAALEAHAALAGVAPQDVVMSRYLHRMVVTHGLPLASAGGLAGRPSVAVPGRQGVFVAGDWVGGAGSARRREPRQWGVGGRGGRPGLDGRRCCRRRAYRVMPVATVFEDQRGRLFGLAYRMLGSVADAEDVVQDAYLRWAGADQDAIHEPAAWLTTVTTRLALDRLRRAQRERATYVGPWLPEPLLTDPEPDPSESVLLAESLSFGVLTVLERLEPVERAVFLLREVFDEPYADIAAIVGRSEAACRQLAHRARTG